MYDQRVGKRLKIKIFNPEFVLLHKVPSDYKAAHAAE